MRTTHIFTVNKDTFKLHLNFMFAGTGSNGIEENLGVLTDIAGVRPGDYVIFYVMQVGFFGIFQIKTGKIYFEPLKNHYLGNELGRTLSYRVFIEPSNLGVYKKGITEWEAIEDPAKIRNKSIFNYQWSWIFKKLGGLRGCTSIPNDEFCNLQKILTEGNERLPVSRSYDYDNNTKQILTRATLKRYLGSSVQPSQFSNITTINYEIDIRLLFTSQAGKLPILNQVLKPKLYGKVEFIANEVKCSFGEQSIDLIFLTETENCLLIELKNDWPVYDQIFYQIKNYARWMSGYKPNIKSIYPILIITEPKEIKTGNAIHRKYLSQADKDAGIYSPWYQSYLQSINDYKIRDFSINKVSNLKIYSFTLNGNQILERFNEL